VSEEVSDDPLTRLTRGVIKSKSCAGTEEKDQASSPLEWVDLWWLGWSSWRELPPARWHQVGSVGERGFVHFRWPTRRGKARREEPRGNWKRKWRLSSEATFEAKEGPEAPRHGQ